LECFYGQKIGQKIGQECQLRHQCWRCINHRGTG
jgi:hypothetical protein